MSKQQAVISLKTVCGKVIDSLTTFISKMIIELTTAKGGKA